MRKLTERNITDVVLDRFTEGSNPRFKEITTRLIRHLHAFISEVGLTPEEWLKGIQFLTEVGHITDEKRQEFILLSDTLGVSALVDLVANRATNGDSTESSLLGPFYREGAPEMPLGASIANETPGDPIVLHGRVASTDGRPLPDALLDVWQASPQGLYDLQDGSQPEMNLRGRFRTDSSGYFEFQSLKPKSYPVPHDGPVGKMLRAQGRHPYRPAHIHFIVSAKGHRPLTTALYIAGDAYLDSDAVFGSRDSLVVRYQPCSGQFKSSKPAGGAAAAPTDAIEFNFNMAPL
ncbi:MAG: intradiol ring-cleavage dioxygenase [Candidatus Binataceae bacterium]